MESVSVYIDVAIFTVELINLNLIRKNSFLITYPFVRVFESTMFPEFPPIMMSEVTIVALEAASVRVFLNMFL